MTDHDHAWEEAERLTKRHAGGKFGKLDDGKSCTVAFVGAPYAFEQHWTPTGSARCDGVGCALCAKGITVKARVRINYFDLNDNVMRIWEGGAPFLRDLKVLKKKYDFAATPFEITRSGLGKNTKYLILPERPMTPEQRARIASEPVHDLAEPGDKQDEAAAAPTNAGGPPAPKAASASETIAADVRNEFITRLQALKSEPALYEFLGAFHCERVSDIPAAEAARARQLLDALERKKSDVNPFS